MHSLTHAVRMVELLSEGGPTGLSALSEGVGIPRATALRVLGTLSEHGWITREGKKYRLTLRLLELGVKVQDATHLQRLADPVLRELVAMTGETAHFAVQDGDRIGYVAKLDSPHPLRMFSHVGWRGPLHATAAGKIVLAYGDPALKENLVLEAFTAQTITDTVHLNGALDLIRKKGYAVDQQELIEGLVCLAAPVHSVNRLVGAISVSGPASRVNETRWQELVTALQQACERLGERLSA
ncbi:IclR family transcriptional regulator [Deinococcus saxicola]|uniref:IclR family transcriptional regulator n=1 Tax=Deinococcus saxicola TaxID=249406 RepID=UPI0039EEBE2A